jgi:hypothetical protein
MVLEWHVPLVERWPRLAGGCPPEPLIQSLVERQWCFFHWWIETALESDDDVGQEFGTNVPLPGARRENPLQAGSFLQQP